MVLKEPAWYVVMWPLVFIMECLHVRPARPSSNAPFKVRHTGHDPVVCYVQGGDKVPGQAKSTRALALD